MALVIGAIHLGWRRNSHATSDTFASPSSETQPAWCSRFDLPRETCSRMPFRRDRRRNISGCRLREWPQAPLHQSSVRLEGCHLSGTPAGPLSAKALPGLAPLWQRQWPPCPCPRRRLRRLVVTVRTVRTMTTSTAMKRFPLLRSSLLRRHGLRRGFLCLLKQGRRHTLRHGRVTPGNLIRLRPSCSWQHFSFRTPILPPSSTP
mmetsp:Transcript_5142/g.11917  ORF Transcript_5142/g.11917 Transcript_5142/m.11917 type:complete len:204 (+) Transcript_5142:209-820(+)